MNILELGIAPALGGLELYFHRCCRELQARGHAIVSVRLAGSRLEALAVKDGIRSFSFQGNYRILPMANARKLARIISENQIDIVHAHLKDNLLLVAMAKVFSSRPFKLVFTRQMPMAQAKKDPYHRWIYSRIDLYITITEQLRKDALKFVPLPPEKIRRLYYGVMPPPPRDNGFIQEFLNLSNERDFNVGVFSRLEFQKGQHLVIEAVRMLREKNIPAKLYVVGDVMYEDYRASLVKQTEEAKLQDHISFKGFLTQPVLAMMGLHVLVLPSRNEAFGLVLIEAMRCEVAVVGVNAGGVPEIIDDGVTGLLFEWDRADQLAEKLELLYRNPSTRELLAKSGKKKADTMFDSADHFQKLEGLFRETLES